ncbi:MAG TPA: hypothetical protein VFD08_02465, partial [Clostridia bacterium]|nr:hypothetical protein [Clostridia bacterium]
MVEIGNTGIYRPNVEIPSGQVILFKGKEYQLIELVNKNGNININTDKDKDIKDNLKEGSLYIPAGRDARGREVTITAKGDIISESDLHSQGKLKVISEKGQIIINDAEVNSSHGELEMKGRAGISAQGAN